MEGTIDALVIACAAVDRRLEDELCAVTQSSKTLSVAKIRAIAEQHPGPFAIAFDGYKPGRGGHPDALRLSWAPTLSAP